eukprot:CAMPEP_0119042128 /NCGR_PEP_ID=MMETSP1177-20130426/14381_1 /TAXON_ID=2985 /ORGANISM="Ochromonas sp, Strain CCMP1899" /LENGTH=239 /DNA_ID=CAMNT_0007008691 /DNA_START=138 /DNA_END=857 /DNA_ORIENTATION=-
MPTEESSISAEVTGKDAAQEIPTDSSKPTTPILNNVVREAVQAGDSVPGKEHEKSKSEVVGPPSEPLTNFQKFQGAVTETAHAAQKKVQEIDDSKEVQNFKRNATAFVEDKEKRGVLIGHYEKNVRAGIELFFDEAKKLSEYMKTPTQKTPLTPNGSSISAEVTGNNEAQETPIDSSNDTMKLPPLPPKPEGTKSLSTDEVTADTKNETVLEKKNETVLESETAVKDETTYESAVKGET